MHVYAACSATANFGAAWVFTFGLNTTPPDQTFLANSWQQVDVVDSSIWAPTAQEADWLAAVIKPDAIADALAPLPDNEPGSVQLLKAADSFFSQFFFSQMGDDLDLD